MTINDDEVICPGCAHQFGAVPVSVQAKLNGLRDWVVERWNAEVKDRPMVNVHRRSLDDAWRQMLRHLGADDRQLLGPTHDELLVVR